MKFELFQIFLKHRIISCTRLVMVLECTCPDQLNSKNCVASKECKQCNIRITVALGMWCYKESATMHSFMIIVVHRTTCTFMGTSFPQIIAEKKCSVLDTNSAILFSLKVLCNISVDLHVIDFGFM